jgi:phenylacetate-coenzyme A ligase PaaK-like adenylate-forming protein
MPSVAALLALPFAIRARRREQWLPADEIRTRRVGRLRRLAAAALAAPYWAEVFARTGVRPETLDDGPGIERLPILEKLTLKERVHEMLTVPASALFKMSTSGSTGRPMTVYRSERDQAEVSALHARIHAAFGRRPLDRQVSIGSGKPAAAKGPVALLRRTGLLPAMHRVWSFDTLASQVDVLRRIRPHVLSGYSVAIEQLAEAVIAAGGLGSTPRLVYTGSMATSERCRRLVEQAFGVRPLDVYATVETGPLAWECPESPGDYHLNDDVQLIEIVDDEGRRVPDGATGEVVVTPLTCLSNPLFRYRLGDLAARRPHRCPCGRGLALLGPVAGRSTEVIRTADGRVLNTAILGLCFSKQPEIRRWQAHQIAPDALRILLVVSPGWNEQAREAALATTRHNLGEAIRYELVVVDDIPPAPNGKFQTIVPLTKETAG